MNRDEDSLDNNQSLDEETIFDDTDPESQPEESYPQEEASEPVQRNTDSYSPNNNFRRNQQNNSYRPRQAYKDDISKSEEALDKARTERDQARAEKQKDTKSVKDLDDNGNAKWKDGQAPKNRTWENGKETTKGAPTKEVEKTKEDKKNDRKELREKNKEYRDAKRANRNAKMNSAFDMANRITHPGQTLKNAAAQPINRVKDKAKEKAKEGIKKAGSAAAKGAKKGLEKTVGAAAKKLTSKLTLKYKVILIASITAIIFVFLLIMLLLGANVAVQEAETAGFGAAACQYDNMGGIGEMTKVEIVECDSTPENKKLITTVSLEKYVAGVVINEMGTEYNTEALRAALIAERSHLLATATTDKNVYNATDDVITIKACGTEKGYWDYTRNVYKSPDGNGLSYDQQEGYTLEKEALDEISRNDFENIARSVTCTYLTDENGKLIDAKVDSSSINSFNEQATANQNTENGTYTAILMQTYSSSSIASGKKINSSYFSGDVGEYSTWKQTCKLGAPWCNVCMNSSCTVTVNDYGCALVSISMLIAHSGVNTSTIANFNPGSFVDTVRSKNYLGDGGGIKAWTFTNNVVPGFTYAGRVDNVNGTISKVANIANQGYFIVLEVRTHNGGQHWVAVNNAASLAAGWSDVYIWDPARDNVNKLSDNPKYRANKFIYYSANR